VNFTASSNARWAQPWAGAGDRQPLLRELVHEIGEAHAFRAEQVRLRHPDVVEEELGRVLAVEPDLVEVAPAA
jgi:hypothetical protein